MSRSMRNESCNGTAGADPRVSSGRVASRSVGHAPRPAWLRFGVAVISVAVGWGLRHALTPLIGPTELPFTVFFLPVVVAAAFGGWRAALLAILLAGLAIRWSFLEPLHSFSIPPWNGVVGLLIFIVVSLLATCAVEKLNQEKELLAVTLRSIGDAVIVTDARGRVTFLNPE